MSRPRLDRLPALLALLTLVPAAPRLAGAPSVTMIVGQPTDRSVTVAARADTALEISYQYGLVPFTYGSSTAALALTPDPYAPGFYVAQTVIRDLEPNSRYYYRLQYRSAGSSGPFTPGEERTFQTQRPPGSTFVFCVQGDSHPERERQMFSPDLYTQTLKAVAAERPDFYVLSGDDFSVDTQPIPFTQPSVTGRYTLQLPYLDNVARTSALFLVTGNHEQTSLYNYNLRPDGTNSNLVPVWAQNARNLYYPLPAPNDPSTGTFYSGNTVPFPGIGPLRDYYAWQQGDALFVVIDPYWGSPALVDNGIGTDTGKTADRWLITHGDLQYEWLKQTLSKSTARWKFVFAHQVLGTGRGGAELSGDYEWGGKGKNGNFEFPVKRPTWPKTIHQLMVESKVTVFFHAHDHLFAHQVVDGVTYQEVPNPADDTYTAFNSDSYKSGDVLPNSGYVKVTVSPSSVKVDYVREFLPKDETPSQKSGQIAFSYTITGGATEPPSAATWLLPSSAHVPGQGGAFYSTDLTVANLGATDASLVLKFLGHDTDGTQGVERSFTLGGGKGVTYTDVLGSIFGVTSGYGAVRVASSAPALAVSSQTWTPAPDSGTFGQSVPAFADSELIKAGSPRTVLGVREDTAFRTNLVLANATAEPLDIDVSLVADTGMSLATKRVSLPALGMTQLPSVVRDLGVAGDVLAARLVLATPVGSFAAYAVLIDNVTNDPRTLLPR